MRKFGLGWSQSQSTEQQGGACVRKVAPSWGSCRAAEVPISLFRKPNMKTRSGTVRTGIVVLALVAAMSPPASAAASDPGFPDITATAKGQELAAAASIRQAALGARTSVSDLRVWQLGVDDFFVADRLPVNLSTSTSTDAANESVKVITFDVTGVISSVRQVSSARVMGSASVEKLSALSASWAWLDQYCFSRMGSDSLGYLDSCYVLHGMVGESDPRDFYQLEQYGTVGAGTFTKIYSGFLEGTQASNSSPMSWIDWSPKSSLSGSCQTIGITVSALGIGISSSGLMCEKWNITKYAAAGHFKEEWSCGCIQPFGQPYPNTREIDYMQAVSVPGGGIARWTLSAGYLAR